MSWTRFNIAFSGKTSKIIHLSLFLFIFTVFNFSSNDWVPDSVKQNFNSETSSVSHLHVEFRNGQVFITWKENINNDQNLRVYLSKEPITSQSIIKAKLLTEHLEPHSANDWYDDPDECARATGPAHGWIIEAGHEPLDGTGGLFVHTVLKEDPHLAYFAVLSKNENDDMLSSGVNSLQEPVSINNGKIQAIWQSSGTQPSGNGKPLAIFLHSHTGRPSGGLTQLFFGDSSMGWREGLPFKFKVSVRPDIVLLEPYDRVWINRKMTADEARANGTYDTLYKNIESWWYGTNDKIYDPELISNGTPTNYTERWLLWVINWVQQNYETDPEKVYAFGASMGTGVLRLVLQNPDRFASVDLLVPLLDPFGEGNIGDRIKPRVGEPQSICSDGIQLKDRLNAINSIKTAKGDLPPIVMRVGRTDKSVTWVRKPDFMKMLQEQKQSLFAGWDNGGHSNAMRKTYEGFPKWYDFTWYVDHFAVNMSYPAFTCCSLDGNPGSGDPDDGDTAGFINRDFDWKIMEDAKTQYEILIIMNRPEVKYPVTVNVTPRHYQQFKNSKKAEVYACNIDSDGKIIEKKNLVVKGGLITYDKFAITSPAGNKLLISIDEIK